MHSIVSASSRGASLVPHSKPQRRVILIFLPHLFFNQHDRHRHANRWVAMITPVLGPPSALQTGCPLFYTLSAWAKVACASLHPSPPLLFCPACQVVATSRQHLTTNSLAPISRSHLRPLFPCRSPPGALTSAWIFPRARYFATNVLIGCYSFRSPSFLLPFPREYVAILVKEKVVHPPPPRASRRLSSQVLFLLLIRLLQDPSSVVGPLPLGLSLPARAPRAAHLSGAPGPFC